MLFSTALRLVAAAAAVAAVEPPQYDGFSLVWQDAFAGAPGDPVDTTRWKVLTGFLSINGELETYTADSSNLQISGGGSVQIVPQRAASGAWTSGRIETRDPIMPTPGKLTRVEGRLRFGSNLVANAATRQGIWPAFWMMGDAVRHGTAWPLCGELDILEQRNGDLTAFGTAHCGHSDSGGVCNEPVGRGATVALPADMDTTFHTWSVTWDLTPDAATAWQSQQIVWALDGVPYFTLTGAAIGDAAIWGTLAHSPFNIILNVAVGGAFPGSPNSATTGGYANMLEAEYVAVYTN